MNKPIKRRQAIELIKSIKKNLRCVTCTSANYEGNNITEIFFNFCLYDIPTLRHEFFYFYGSGYIENTFDIESEGNYTAFIYKLFGGSEILLHFSKGEIDEKDDDRNDEEANQDVPDWI